MVHAEQHGYVPPGSILLGHNPYDGSPAPPGFAFNVMGELVELPFEPWGTGPQFPWESPENPDYVEYAKGRATIENQPSADPRLPARYGKGGSQGHVAPMTHEHVALVPETAMLERDGDLIPQQDEGTGSQAVFDAPASIARTRYILSKHIVGYAEVEPPLPGTNSPLLVVPSGTVQGAPAVAPFGGAVALATFQFGHLGSQVSNVTCDVLPGSFVRAPTASSFMRITGRIAPRYFAHKDTGALPHIFRAYLLFPGGPQLTSDSFTDLPPNIMDLQGNGAGTIVAANAQGVPVNYLGWCAVGLPVTPVEDNQPRRIFNGTVPSAAPAPAAPFTNQSIVPIPRGAIAARVIGGFVTTAGTPPIPITWAQNLDVLGGSTGPFLGNTDQPIPIVPGAQFVSVFAGNDPVAAANTEVPFAVVYYMNL
jgi:hypothetical protein